MNDRNFPQKDVVNINLLLRRSRFMKISDTKLLEETKKVAKQEQLKTLELLTFLAEVDRRMAYVSLGYASLFAYLTHELGYSGSEAALRVNAMRLIKKVPAAQEKIATGALTLSTAASILSFARTENVDVKELVGECEHKSTREVTKILEDRRELKKVEFTIKLTGSAAEKFARLKKLFPELGDCELIESVVEEKLTRVKLNEKKIDEAKVENQQDVKSSNTENRGYKRTAISRATLRTLFTRAQNQCEYVDKKTMKRCQESRQLQSDHIYPVAWGGTNHLANLRILCRTHNLASAVSCFGANKRNDFSIAIGRRKI